MEPEQIYWNDWKRIFIGDVPASFFIELIIRAFFIYLLLLVSMRLMGKRMSSQLTRNQLAALVSLAAAVGVPMLAPDRGLLPAYVIAIVVVLIERAISTLAAKNQVFEKFSQGNIGTLIKDGVVEVKVLKGVRVSINGLYSELRSQGVKHLGTIKRFYMEANGEFTLVTEENPKPGLSVLPEWDTDFRALQKIRDDLLVCNACGMKKAGDNSVCTNCGKEKWEPAVE